MAVLSNIPVGVTRKELKELDRDINKLVPNKAIREKTISFMFNNTLTYTYTDSDITDTCVLDVVPLVDHELVLKYGIDFEEDIENHTVTFKSRNMPYDELGIASIGVKLLIIDI